MAEAMISLWRISKTGQLLKQIEEDIIGIKPIF